MSSRKMLLMRATKRVQRVLAGGNTGSNQNPEKGQFVKPMDGFTSFHPCPVRFDLHPRGRG